MTQTSIERCIEECLSCMEACNHCFNQCLNEEDVQMMANCIRLDRDCADICALAIRAMQTQSPFIHEICRLCAEACLACAEECEKHNHDHCQKCAEACRRCAEACKEMVV